MAIQHLSDDELRQALRKLAADERGLIGELLHHLIEADARRLAGSWGFDSLFSYCTTELRFSEGATYKRINAARAAARVPLIFEYLESGKVHLDGIVSLSAYLNASNARDVLDRATGKTSREIQVLVAELAPQPDRPDFLRRMAAGSPPAIQLAASAAVPAAETPAPAAETPAPAAQALPPAEELDTRALRLLSGSSRDEVTPRSPGRHYIGFTAGDGLRDKLLRAQALLRQSKPDASYEDVMEQALDAWLERKDPERGALRREARRRKSPIAVSRRRSGGKDRSALPQASRDAVYLRDGGRCTHVTKAGVRCKARTRLEFDHIVPRAKGGTDDLSNLRLLCREHNRTEAVREFGAALVGRHRRGSVSSGDTPFFRTDGGTPPPDTS